jgi:trimeric autotransporter adhesin
MSGRANMFVFSQMRYPLKSGLPQAHRCVVPLTGERQLTQENSMKIVSSPRGSRFSQPLKSLRNAAARLGVSALLALTLLGIAAPAAAATSAFVVNIGSTDLADKNKGDGICADVNNQCSLRAAIEEANALANTLVGGVATPHTITFSVTTVNVINGGLPMIAAPVTITGVPGVTTISGNNSGAGSKQGCISLTDSGTAALNHGKGATGTKIFNLSIGNCSGDGISANGHDYTFSNNRIGVNALGVLATPNTGHGISVSATQVYPDTSTAFLSSTYAGFPVQPVDASQINAFQSNLTTALASLSPVIISGNVISGNTLNGIEIFSQNLAGVIASGNMIGTDVTGNLAIANGGAGVHMVGSTFGNLIGPNNVISGNTGNGIQIDAGAVFLPNFIMGNRIGLSSTNAGNHIGNGGSGITTDTKPSTDPTKLNPSMIGLVIGPANLISDNQGANNNAFPDVLASDSAGIVITGASTGVKVLGNTIGMGEFPPGTPVASKAYGNLGDGIIVTSSGNTIGGSTAGAGNTIAGNARHGIVVRGSGTTATTILGNSIGVHPSLAGNLAIGNGVDGIHIGSASSTSVGGAGATDANVVAGNGRNGMKLVNGGTANGWSNLFQRNQIYSNAKLLAGVGIDLDHAQNATNDSSLSEFPANYVNLDQVAARICTGPADTGACAGATAPSSVGTITWAIATHGPADFRAEFFLINAASSNAATSMQFVGEQLFSTSAAGVPSTSGCAAGRCTTSLPGVAPGSSVLMTVTDITALTDTPSNGGDWKGQLKCLIGNLGVILSSCNVNNTSEYSNAVAIPLSNNANLSALTVSVGSLVPVFASGTLVYGDAVANAVTSITVTPTVAQANASVKVNGNTVVSGAASGAIALAVGANAVTVLVTAQDGTTTQTYTVNVTRAAALSSNANLISLSVSSGSLVPVFASGTLVYSDAVANAVTSITVTPTVADATATVKVNGNTVVSGSASGAIALAVGANAITVLVTAQDGTTTKTYTVNVTRAAALSGNANLSALSVSSGSLVPVFASGTLVYSDAVANAVTSITVTPTVADVTATVKGNGSTVVSGSASGAIALAVGANAITVLVTAQDGTTTQTYTINVNRAGALSNNASLNALAVSSGSLVPAFASATLVYSDAVANGVSTITVTPTVADATATVKVNGNTVVSGSASAAIALAVGANAVTVLVTAQDGTTTQTYTINVTRAGALSNNASLSALAVSSGSLVPAFASATSVYADAVANGVASITLTPTVADATATVKVNGNTVVSGSASGAIALAVGANAITVLVTAQDGTTTTTYTVNVTRAAALSSNATLSALSFSSGSLVPMFASGTLMYADAVANGVTSITVTPTVADATATVKVNGNTVVSGSASAAIPLAVGANAVTVLVTAQDGTTTQTYTVNVTRAAPVVTLFSGTTFTGTGIATATLSGGGATCSFGSTAFVGPSVAAPAGVSFPDGLFDFTATNCTGTITVTVVFPTPFAAGAQYWKYGPTAAVPAPHWYTLAAGAPNNLVLSVKTATFTITDGGLGDDDLTVNGTIVDAGGIGVSAAVAAVDPVNVPTLGPWSLLLLSGLMLLGFVGVGTVWRRAANTC